MRAGRLMGMGLAAFLLFGAICQAQDSLNVTKLGEYAFWDIAYDVVVSGELAFVATEATGLKIVDISSLEGPIEIGNFDTPGSAIDLAIIGNYAYVADEASGLRILDISDPTNPIEVGSCETTGFAFGVAINGDYAYVAESDIGLGVINISNPSSPQETSVIETPGLSWKVAISGSHAYLADGYAGGVRVFDIADPATPIEVGSYDTPGWSNDIAIGGNYAYISDGWCGLLILNITDPTQPSYVAAIGTPGGYSTDLAISDNYIYIAAGFQYGELYVFNVSNPSSPIQIASYEAPAYEYGIALSNNSAFVACSTAGLRVLSTIDPTNPTEIGSCDPPHFGECVAVNENYAFVGTNDAGMRIFSISNPFSPAEIGYFLPQYPTIRAIKVVDSLCYLANGYNGGLLIVDIAQPLAPVEVGSFVSDADVYDVVVSGDLAFLAGGGSGLIILDISDPANPIEMGSYSAYSLDFAKAVLVSGDYAYVGTTVYDPFGDNRGELWILDVSNPESPSLLSTFDFLAGVSSLAMVDNFVYCCNYSLHIIDITNPVMPLEVGNYPSVSGYIRGIVLDANHAFIVSNGLQVLDISTPEAPIEVGHYYVSLAAEGIAVSNELAYVANSYYFGIYDCSAALPVNPWEAPRSLPSSFILHPPHPNPFNPATVITFDLPVASLVKLEVFDINGRSVGAGLKPAPTSGSGATPTMYPAGTHQITFDGSALPSGIYLARLTAGDWSAVQKLILMK